MANITYNPPEMSKEREFIKIFPINPFTPRQRQIIEYAISESGNRKKIAAKIGIGPDTVKKHVEGNRKSNKPGIYGIIESVYGVRPHRLHQVVGLVNDDILKIEIENPEFRIETLNSKRVITMSIEDKTWVLINNLSTRTADNEARIYHRRGILTKSDLPFNISESLRQDKLVPLDKKLKRGIKIVGLYMEAEKYIA